MPVITDELLQLFIQEMSKVATPITEIPAAQTPLLTPAQTLEARLRKPHVVERELEFVAFEAAQVYQLIMQFNERAQQLGRGLAVVGNQSYGELAVLPIKALLEQQRIPVYSMKVPSLTDMKNYAPEILELPKDLLKRLVTDQPLLVVVDGTRTNSVEKYARYPRSMLGYVALCAAVNEALGMPSGLGVISSEQLMRLRGQQGFGSLVDRLRQDADSRTISYAVAFWNPTGLEGVIGIYHVSIDGFKDKVVQQVNLANITGPVMVLATSTVPASSQLYARRGLPSGHVPAYFDDRPWKEIAGLQEKLQVMVARHLPEAQ